MTLPIYCLTEKIGNKKYILATWTGDKQSCIRLAQTVFNKHGLNTNENHVDWTEVVIEQKMFGGYHPDCKNFTETLAEAEEYFDLEHLNFRLYNLKMTKEQILEENPEFEKYFK